MNYQIDAFDSWSLHENEIQVQSNQRFFFSPLRDSCSPLRGSHAALPCGEISRKNLLDQGKIPPSLCKIFNLSLSHAVVPVLWKRANVTPVFKKDDPTLAENYRPISLLCIVSKVLERCVFNHCYLHFPPLLYNLQHGFLRGKSLLEVYHDILDMVAGGQEVDVIHLDLSKAFDKVPHDLLLTKRHRHGISGTALRLFEGYLSDRQQRVVLGGTFSDWLPVTSGVPQGCCSWFLQMKCRPTYSMDQASPFLRTTANFTGL